MPIKFVILHTVIMNRIFHYRVTAIDMSAIVLMALLSFYFFWMLRVVVALPVAAVWVLMVERVLHTTYTFTPEALVVSGGRFSRTRSIAYADVSRCQTMTNCFGLVGYVLVEYGKGRSLSLKPQMEQLFVDEMTKRITVKQ